jgi:hypothetical protein
VRFFTAGYLRAFFVTFLFLTSFACTSRALVAPRIVTTDHTLSASDRIAQLEQQVAENKATAAAATSAAANAQSAGDNAWVLTSSLLVLMMTGPGLALFYCGLVRKKNVLGTMMQSFSMMAVITVLWVVCGYSLAFGSGNAFIGGLHNAFLHGVGLTPNAYAPTIPAQSFMIYQLMFAIITPALIAGAFAERIKFSAMLLFSVLWTLGHRRPVECSRRRTFSVLRLCRRHRGPHHLRCLGAGDGTLSRQAAWIFQGTAAAAQHGALLYRRLPAVGGMVRIQRGQCAGRGIAGHQCLRQHTIRSRGGGY